MSVEERESVGFRGCYALFFPCSKDRESFNSTSDFRFSTTGCIF